MKFVTLQELAQISPLQLILALVVLHPLSRAVAGSLIYDMNYVRDNDAKAKPVAEQQRKSDLVILVLLGCLPLFLLPAFLALPLVIAQYLLRLTAKRYLNSRLGGYTGDCLGAVQQVSEIVGYLILLAFMSHGGTV